jgi:hypothetical protein
LVIAIFFALPALQLIKAVTFPMVQPEDRRCVAASRFGLWLFVAVFLGRSLWAVTNYYHGNALENYKAKPENFGAKRPWPRVIDFFFWFIFDIVPSAIVQIAVFMFEKHWLMFNANPSYTRIGQ